MSLTAAGPEAQDALFDNPMTTSRSNSNLGNVPESLKRATLRMEFPPSYVLVGVYRLFTDKLLYKPAWDKCKHAVRRGAIVGAIWTFCTFSIQKKVIEIFLSNSPRIAGLRDDTIFGYELPFSVYTYATIMFLGSQVTYILQFFLGRNIRIARDRVWDQTVASRGKGPDFWKPYVEEWEIPPKLEVGTWQDKIIDKWLGGWFGLFVVKRILLTPLSAYPFVGVAVSAWFKALGTSRFLHRRYFESKKMSNKEIAVFMEERKWDYRVFGFSAALLESIPIIGLVFTISNRIGAAMWAHDLEKKQHFIAEEKSRGHLNLGNLSKTE